MLHGIVALAMIPASEVQAGSEASGTAWNREPSTSRTICSANEGGEGKALASSSSTAMMKPSDVLTLRLSSRSLKTTLDVQQPTEANTDDIRTPHLDPDGDNQAEQNQEDSASHDQAEHHAQEEQDHHTTQEEPMVSSSQPNDQVTNEDSLQPEQDHHTTQEEPVLNLSKDDQKKMSCAVWNNRDVGGSDHMGLLRFQVNERR
ncbi:hypothetical protein DY000_02006639 [Brassica cretica]|uniref:Uncharacterized protein n=1 Tax=Brassica cretica TaxID=69181 RepID=A0ABQ7CCW7_BRACR|nr:hypothetical protein DY000_02006639 [Brassica cretica]